MRPTTQKFDIIIIGVFMSIVCMSWLFVASYFAERENVDKYKIITTERIYFVDSYKFYNPNSGLKDCIELEGYTRPVCPPFDIQEGEWTYKNKW